MPVFIALRGIRAGILDGDMSFFVVELVDDAIGLRRTVGTGVLVAVLGRELAGVGLAFEEDFGAAIGADGTDGVLDRGGGGARAAEAAISSR